MRRVASLALAALLATAATVAGVTSAPPARAVVPGFNGKIAFESSRSGTSNIWSVNADGTGLRNLSSNQFFDHSPAFSPDGTKIAFVSSRTGGIWVMNADGSNQHLLHAQTIVPFGISWSGDGSKIAYADSNHDIWTINADGTGATDVVSGSDVDYYPSWSPDGTKLVFRHNNGIAVADADGTHLVALTNPAGGAVDQAPSFSPDGANIIFDRTAPSPDTNSNAQLWRMGADGNNPTQLTALPGFNAWPRYSPDGTKLAFQQASSSDGPFDLRVSNADGSNPRALAVDGADDILPDWQSLTNDPNGTFVPLQPQRILDTRAGPGGALGPGESMDVQALGAGGVPAGGVSAVVINVTVTEPTTASYMTAWPTGTARPNASNLNYVKGQTVPNLVVVKVGAGGKFSLYNNAGSTHVVADVNGYYVDGSTAAGDRYTALPPQRILDTRSGVGGFSRPVGPGETIEVHATGTGGVPAFGVSSVVVNVTVTAPTAASYMTAWESGFPRPTASNLNYVPGQTVANLVVVKVGGGFSLYNNAGSTQAIADVVGYFNDGPAAPGDRYIPITPQRILDTRSGTGGFSQPIGQGQSIDVQGEGSGGVPNTGVSAVAVNLTATDPTASSYMTAWPAGTERPTASNLNYVPGATVPNLAVVKVGSNGKFSLYNNAGSTQAIADVVGYLTG